MTAPLFALKGYQVQALAALRKFLEKAIELGDADTAFYSIARRPFLPPPGLPGLPYVCLRVPTGGGKTILAAHSVAVAADSFLRTDTPTVLWLVPSQTILDQTLATLSDRAHPNRRALADRFGENLRVMGIADALYAKRADYDGGAVVIVATIQAFRVEATEGRKVYEASGELMDHFSGLPDALRAVIELGPSRDPVPSLANVLRMRRPMVIVDEAHNVRTGLSFDTLARLKPSMIVEFTATPVTPEEHDPAKGVHASNVLHHVSAAELKAADMIKLPVVLRGRQEARDTIGDAIAWLDELGAVARCEEEATGEFVRPVMLVQAEPKSKDRQTLHAEAVKAMLIADFRVPEEHIALATGDSREIDDVDLFDRGCQIRFIITQQALREGWDCSFAYVLCSVAEQKSPRAVEQLLGRVLRLPRASKKTNEALNQAYAFATTTSFQNAAKTLQDGLVHNGFERIEAKALIKVAEPAFQGFEDGGAAFFFDEPLPADIDAEAFKTNVETATGGRVEVDVASGRLRARGALSDYDKTAMLLAFPETLTATIEALVHKSRGARLRDVGAAADAIRFAVPRLAVRGPRGLELFDRSHFLDVPWKLETCDPAPILDEFQPPKRGVDEAVIDVTDAGKVTVDFVNDLHRQLALALEERGWTKSSLVNWLDRRLPLSCRRDITRVSSTLFIVKALDTIDAHYGLRLEGLARAKFRLVEALVRVIGKHRDEREASAFQRALFAETGLDFETSSAIELVFQDRRYGYNRPYSGAVEFKKHHFRIVGDLEASGEEFECAVYLERHAAVRTWVRNTVHERSFWLQTSSDRFYPDFVALLTDGRVLVVEYKGSHLATADDAKEKQAIGELWADRSGGKALFVMVQDRQFGRIEAAIQFGSAAR